MDAGSDIEMGLNWGFGGGLKGEEEALGVGDNEGGGRHGSSEQAKPMEDASKRSSRTNSHSRQVPLHPPRHQHLHLYPYSRVRSEHAPDVQSDG